MTCVRRLSHRSRLTFISQRWKDTAKARLRNKRPREDAGRSIPPQRLDTYVFSGSELKGIVAAVAASISYGVFVAPRRRARSEVILQMKPDNSDGTGELDAQQQPGFWLHRERGVLN